jgi:hypothetical protein
MAARKISCTTWYHIITDFGSCEKEDAVRAMSVNKFVDWHPVDVNVSSVAVVIVIVRVDGYSLRFPRMRWA